MMRVLPVELAVGQETLDEEHEDLERNENNESLYSLGSIREHDVVIARLLEDLIVSRNSKGELETRDRV